MATYFKEGGVDAALEDAFKERKLKELLATLRAERGGSLKRVLLLPPDHTRFYSDAGKLTAMLWKLLKDEAFIRIMPALGTHVPMTEEEIRLMFGPDIPLDLFLEHDWRNGLKAYGSVPGEWIAEISEGKVDYSIQVAVNRVLEEGKWDLILSIGQVVPHEVVGLANYTKNILIGVGGGDTIHKSHFLGAVFGMERMMGRLDTPVRKALDKGFHDHLGHLGIVFLLTVMGKKDGKMIMRGFSAGTDGEAFDFAARLSQKVNLDLLDKPIKRAVVYLEPGEFKTTWLGNKAIYRLRMAMADDGELIILAPALHRFGEDMGIDALIRKYGYRGTDVTLAHVKENEEMRGNLSAAAHLIHGSSEGRFRITYCPGPGVTREEIEGVGFGWRDHASEARKYDVTKLKDGWNTDAEGEFFYVSNPALGLWALKRHFV